MTKAYYIEQRKGLRSLFIPEKGIFYHLNRSLDNPVYYHFSTNPIEMETAEEDVSNGRHLEEVEIPERYIEELVKCSNEMNLAIQNFNIVGSTLTDKLKEQLNKL